MFFNHTSLKLCLQQILHPGSSASGGGGTSSIGTECRQGRLLLERGLCATRERGRGGFLLERSDRGGGEVSFSSGDGGGSFSKAGGRRRSSSWTSARSSPKVVRVRHPSTSSGTRLSPDGSQRSPGVWCCCFSVTSDSAHGGIGRDRFFSRCCLL